MKKQIQILLLATVLLSCEKVNKSKTDSGAETPNSTEIQKSSDKNYEKYIYSKQEYSDAAGKSLIIENSLPKGGLKFTDSNGKIYVYAVFWTRIINETESPFELEIDFPAAFHTLKSFPENNLKLLIPSDTLAFDKLDSVNFGLKGLASFLDKNTHKASSLKKTINTKESSGFYVITLFEKGLNGTLRTGFSLKGQNLFYKLNNEEILCGKLFLSEEIQHL